MRKQRLDFIDIYKGLGIILIIMGHIGFGKTFGIFIHFFHVPMFFFISGYLFKYTERFDDYITNKIKTLLIPYYFFGFFHLVMTIIEGSFQSSFLLSLCIFCTHNLPIAGAIWFLMSLFISNTLYYLINKIKNDRIKCFVAILISIFWQVFKRVTGITFPFGLGPALVGVGLMHMGFLFRRIKYDLCHLNYVVLVFLSIIPLAVSFLSPINVYENMREELYPLIIFFWIMAFICILVCLNISKLLDDSFKKTIVSQFLISIGKNSIIYLVFNQLVIQIVDSVLNGVGLNLLLCRLINLIATLLVLFLISILFSKTKLRYFFGRF